jgi:hypothetical protein
MDRCVNMETVAMVKKRRRYAFPFGAVAQKQ